MSRNEGERETEAFAGLAAKSSASSVDFVVNSVKELLLARKILPGDRLPAEMELAKLLSVSRGSVREAMKILSALGVVEVKRGDGTYVASSSGAALFDPLLFRLIVSQPDFRELKEFRQILELNVVRLAIRNAGDAQLQALRDCYESMQGLKGKPVKEYEELLTYDLEFHNLLGQACGNGPLETIYRFVMQYFKSYIGQSLRRQSSFSADSVQAHAKILQAVAARDIAAAEQAVIESLEVWEKLVLQA